MRVVRVILIITLWACGAHALSRYDTADFWGIICSAEAGPHVWSPRLIAAALPPVAACGAEPTTFQELPSVGGIGQNVSVDLSIGYDPTTQRLCYVSTSLPVAPVIRVSPGQFFSVSITNTLQNSTADNAINCPIDVYGGEGSCVPLPQFLAKAGADGSYYPIMANQAHAADGTSNLHVHGLMVSPRPCSDEVLKSTIYPADWRGPVGRLLPCQASPNTLTYTYDVPNNHPAGLYWYHTHRHGQAEHQTQMGLAGAIVVEDSGDAYRASIGVTDEVLLVDDTPVAACIVGPQCDVARHVRKSVRRPAETEAEAPGPQATAISDTRAITSRAGMGPVLDPRIDQADQAGSCAQGASGSAGGFELWTLTLNGAAVPEGAGDGTFPPDSELLSKAMQPGQRQIFRLVNASANSFLAPKLVLSQNGVQTVLPLEVFARDGVGLADAAGARHLTNFDVATNQFVLPPASRVEFVVHAPPVGATLYLQSDQVLPGCAGNEYPARRLLLITSSGTPVNPGAADDSDLLMNTPSLAPYFATLGTTATVHRTFVFSEYGRQFTYDHTKWLSGPPTAADYDPSATDFFITETASDDGEVNPNTTAVVPFVMSGKAQPPVVVHLRGQKSVTEQWLIQNSTLEIHDFHIHQIHFRDISAQSSNPDLQPILDTITVPAAPLIGKTATGHPGAPGWVLLQMTFTKQDIGEFVFHCHILEHEDNGMMQRIQVVAN